MITVSVTRTTTTVIHVAAIATRSARTPACHTWTAVAYTSVRSHASEEVATTIHLIVTRHRVVEMVDVAVVFVYAETPSVVVECDRTVEVVISDESIPDDIAEQHTESEVALFAEVEIILITITESYIIEVCVETIDIVEVDTIDVLEEIEICDSESVCHTVSEETCVVAHCVV